MNFFNRILIIGIASAIACSTSWAATVIERNEFGKQQTITLDEEQVRIDSPIPHIYMLMDLKKAKVYMINTKEREIVKMNLVGESPQPPRQMRERSRDRQQQSWQQTTKPELVHKGKGPNIAGYPTVSYQVKANDKVCSENYFSHPAAEVAYLENFIKAMSKMANSRKPKGMPLPPCLKAYEQLEAKSMKLGIPMKIIFKGGRQGDKVADEITSIKTNVKVAANTFALPTDYKMMTEQEMREKAQQEMRRRMEEARQGGGQSSYRMPPRQGDGRDSYNAPPRDWQREGGRGPYNQDWQREGGQPGGPPPRNWHEGGRDSYNTPPRDWQQGGPPPRNWQQGGRDSYNAPPRDWQQGGPPPRNWQQGGRDSYNAPPRDWQQYEGGHEPHNRDWQQGDPPSQNWQEGGRDSYNAPPKDWKPGIPPRNWDEGEQTGGTYNAPPKDWKPGPPPRNWDEGGQTGGTYNTPPKD
jgi:hypothetical protein